MMLTGREIPARRALKMGLVDELVPLGKLYRAARLTAERLGAQAPRPYRPKTFVDWLLEGTVPGRALLFRQAEKNGLAAKRRPLPRLAAHH